MPMRHKHNSCRLCEKYRFKSSRFFPLLFKENQFPISKIVYYMLRKPFKLTASSSFDRNWSMYCCQCIRKEYKKQQQQTFVWNELNKRQCEDEFKIFEWKVYIKKKKQWQQQKQQPKKWSFFLQRNQTKTGWTKCLCIDVMDPMYRVNHFVSSAFK